MLISCPLLISCTQRIKKQLYKGKGSGQNKDHQLVRKQLPGLKVILFLFNTLFSLSICISIGIVLLYWERK